VNRNKPRTTESDAGAKGADDDVLSDPAKGTDDRADWSDEGGATPSGPAEDTDDR
jgi:hypothetical protein